MFSRLLKVVFLDNRPKERIMKAALAKPSGIENQ
jgi:hypothetical protein